MSQEVDILFKGTNVPVKADLDGISSGGGAEVINITYDSTKEEGQRYSCTDSSGNALTIANIIANAKAGKIYYVNTAIKTSSSTQTWFSNLIFGIFEMDDDPGYEEGFITGFQLTASNRPLQMFIYAGATTGWHVNAE